MVGGATYSIELLELSAAGYPTFGIVASAPN